jgi:oligosaccharide repeat unit polymerase
MLAVVSFLFCLVALVAWDRCKTPFNPITPMLLIWAVLIPFSDSELYSLNATSGYAYTLVISGLSAYTAGCLFGMKGGRGRFRGGDCGSFDFSQRLNRKFLYAVAFVSLAVLAYQTLQALVLLRRGYTLGMIRGMLFAYEENEMRTSAFLVMLQKFVVTPSVALMTSLIPVELFLVKKAERDKWLLLLASLMVVLSVLSSGGRIVIVILGMYVATALALLRRQAKTGAALRKTLSLRRKILITLFVFAAVFVLYRITLARKGADVDLVRQVFIYFGAPIKFLDYCVERLDTQLGQFRAYGMSSFYGFLYPLLFVWRFASGQYPAAFLATHEYSVTMLQNSVGLGGGISINAFATMFFQPYIDAGLFGVVLVPFCYGFFAGRSYYHAFFRNSALGLLFFFTVEYQILFSVIRFWYTQVGNAMWIVFILLGLGKPNRRKLPGRPPDPESGSVPVSFPLSGGTGHLQDRTKEGNRNP